MLETKADIAEKLKSMMVEKLRLPMKPEEIDMNAPLLGEGIGLDSVDLIELVAWIHTEFEVIMTNEHRAYFENINTMSEFIYNRAIEMGKA